MKLEAVYQNLYLLVVALLDRHYAYLFLHQQMMQQVELLQHHFQQVESFYL